MFGRSPTAPLRLHRRRPSRFADPPRAAPPTVRPATVLSQTAFGADVEKLPSWESVVSEMRGPECVLHFRGVRGAYVPKSYELKYSDLAMSGEFRWTALIYKLMVTVTRPDAKGNDEVLPERLAVRGVCVFPDAKREKFDGPSRGQLEALARVEAILSELGPAGTGESTARSSPGSAGASWAGLIGRAWGWLWAQPLSAQTCLFRNDDNECLAWSLSDLPVTVHRPMRCPAGFDYEAVTDSCSLSTGLGGGDTTPGSSEGSGSGNAGNNNNGEPKLRDVEFTLSCSTPTRGANGSCSVSAPDSAGVNMGSLNYSWSSTIGTATVATEPNGESSWGGTATENVNVKVEVTDPAGTIAGFTDSERITVEARDWTWPAGDDLGERNGSIPDSCYGNAMGLTVGRTGGGSCSGYFFDYLDGFAVSSGSGPWESRSYVASTDDESVAGAFWGANPAIRSDGPAYGTGTLLASIRRQSGCRSSANVYTVNACSANEKTSNDRSAAFDDLVEEVEDHEADHVSAVVTEAAKHDVWGEWETIVSPSESGAKTKAQTAASTVQAALLSATQAVDGAYSSKTFEVWWWTGSEWARRGIQTGH